MTSSRLISTAHGHVDTGLADDWEAAQWPAGWCVRRKPLAGLRLMTLNLGLLGIRLFGRMRLALADHVEERIAAAAPLIRNVAADVVALQEIFDDRDRRALSRALQDIYPYSSAVAANRSLFGSGLMVLSRHPMRNTVFVPRLRRRPLARVASRRGYLRTDIALPDFGTMAVVNLHLMAEIAKEGAASARRSQRCAEIAQLLDLADALDHPAVLIGDFNASPLVSPAVYGAIAERGYLDVVAAGRDAEDAEALATWDPANALNAGGRYRHEPRQRIDHVFLAKSIAERIVVQSSGIVLNEARVATRRGPVPLSDHFGVTVDLVARAASDAMPAAKRRETGACA